jgi:hypothetical protein
MNTSDKEPALESMTASQDTRVIWHKRPRVKIVLIAVIALLSVFIVYAMNRIETELPKIQKMTDEMKSRK